MKIKLRRQEAKEGGQAIELAPLALAQTIKERWSRWLSCGGRRRHTSTVASAPPRRINPEDDRGVHLETLLRVCHRILQASGPEGGVSLVAQVAFRVARK